MRLCIPVIWMVARMRSTVALNKMPKPVPMKPRTENQRKYVDLLHGGATPVVFGVGPAGCGKTLFACNAALRSLKAHEVSRIVITRPLVAVEGESIGYLPGTMRSKMDPWTRPIVDVLTELMNKEYVEALLASGIAEISPLGYMRGRTFKDAFIIADEMQNSTPNQMKMLLTRIGEGSRLIVNGDPGQSDAGPYESGLDDILKRIERHKESSPGDLIRVVQMDADDIQRSPVVAHVINLYERPF